MLLACVGFSDACGTESDPLPQKDTFVATFKPAKETEASKNGARR